MGVHVRSLSELFDFVRVAGLCGDARTSWAGLRPRRVEEGTRALEDEAWRQISQSSNCGDEDEKEEKDARGSDNWD